MPRDRLGALMSAWLSFMGTGEVGTIIGIDSFRVLFRTGVPSIAKEKWKRAKKLFVMCRAPPDIHKFFAHVAHSVMFDVCLNLFFGGMDGVASVTWVGVINKHITFPFPHDGVSGI